MKQGPAGFVAFFEGFCFIGTIDLILALLHVMGDLPTQHELATAHERRARIIAQLHQQAIATANDLSAIKAKIAKWLFIVGTVLLALGCFAAGWIVA
jgi:hypothetical protein